MLGKKKKKAICLKDSKYCASTSGFCRVSFMNTINLVVIRGQDRVQVHKTLRIIFKKKYDINQGSDICSCWLHFIEDIRVLNRFFKRVDVNVVFLLFNSHWKRDLHLKRKNGVSLGMHSIRTQGAPLMNRLTFPCLSAVVFPPPTGYVACFILSWLKCFKTQRRKKAHGNLLFQSYFLRLLRKPSVHHFNNLSKKCKFFLKFVNFSPKKCQDKVLYL